MKTREAKEILNRFSKLDSMLDVLGPAARLTWPSNISSSRMIMYQHQISQAVSVQNPDVPLLATGFENPVGLFSYMVNKSDGDYEIVEKFSKNDYNTVIIGWDPTRRHYHAWRRKAAEPHFDSFATLYDNSFIDSLEIGDHIAKDTVVQKSTNFDKYMNLRFGKNLNVCYGTNEWVYEDGILVMNGADKLIGATREYSANVSLKSGTELINLYGDKSEYRAFPDIGEKIRHGILAVIRGNQDMEFFGKHPDRLRQPMFASDIPISGLFGRVVDITVKTNSNNPPFMNNRKLGEQILHYWTMQQQYYHDLYDYMMDIIDHADERGYTCSKEFTIIAAEAMTHLDSGGRYEGPNRAILTEQDVIITFDIIDIEAAVPGTKLVGRSANKGVCSKITKINESWHMEDGVPIHLLLSGIGVPGRLNPAGPYELCINDIAQTAVECMKIIPEDDPNHKLEIVYECISYFNRQEAKQFKKFVSDLSFKERQKEARRIERDGIIIVNPPIGGANIVTIAEAYERFPSYRRRIRYEDGSLSLRKFSCAPMYMLRLKQDPWHKMAARFRGTVNPVTTLPSKDPRHKSFIDWTSHVPVKMEELQSQALLTMIAHRALLAEWMRENSTNLDAKMSLDRQNYQNPPGVDPDPSKIALCGSKPAEYIGGYLNLLNTKVDIEYKESTPEDPLDDGLV